MVFVSCHLAHIFVFSDVPTLAEVSWNLRSRDSEVEFKIERHLPGSGSSMIILPIC